MNEQLRIGRLKGIGEKTEKLFEKIEVRTIEDLLRYFPKEYARYEQPIAIADADEGKIVAIDGILQGKVHVSAGRTMQVTTAMIKDGTGTIRAVWFRMPFLRNTLRGGRIILRGRVTIKNNIKTMEHPEIFYPAEKYQDKCGSLQPVYALTEGLTNNMVVKAVKQAIEYAGTLESVLPDDVCHRANLVDYRMALEGIHFPKNIEEYQSARERFVFEEFFLFVVALQRLKNDNQKEQNHYRFDAQEKIQELISQLPYTLTDAQQRVLSEIFDDLSGDSVMCRLVQGDVGSGKTILAFLSMFQVGLNGYQSAMMAPTEVLANQHYENLCKMLEEYNIPLKAELLTGSMTTREKREAYERIALGNVQLIIGTHALIQEHVEYKNLALVVTDEQHRFGVRQRENFAEKGNQPHILVMSATPIPRTLAMILYGDLSISVVDELPKNRLPIKNCVVDTGYRKTAYRFIKNQVKEGRQCYVICPMVEESEFLDGENVLDYTKILREELGDEICVEYLHGKMKQQEKDERMLRFARNEIQVLVSTTVIEVGIDVPNATTIMIENAERFGLAQLHQLRGRVGRGRWQSYCILLSTSKTKETQQRLDVLKDSNDGFYIASQDLKLRGPGDLFGIRQSGLMDFRLGDIYQDAKLLQISGECAAALLEEDATLHDEGHARLRRYLEHNLHNTLSQTTL